MRLQTAQTEIISPIENDSHSFSYIEIVIKNCKNNSPVEEIVGTGLFTPEQVLIIIKFNLNKFSQGELFIQR